MANYITYGMSDSMIVKTLGKQIKQMRINSSMSQQDLSASTGLSRSTISAIESGRNISTINLIAILRSLGKLNTLDAFRTQAPISPVEIVRHNKIPQRIRSKSSIKNRPKIKW